MCRAFLFLTTVVSLFVASPAHAAQVEGLQAPAWLERAGQKQPLRPGMTLTEADVIETGQGGRALLLLADGSLVKLGEQTQLAFERLDEARVRDGVLRGVLEVKRGAIRYTTDASGRAVDRIVELRAATTTLVVRVADVWARNRDGVSTVCLIEGRVTLRHPARGEFEVDQPASFFVAPRDGEPQPVAPVAPDDLRQWSEETELTLGRGVLLPGGGWIVQLGSHQDEAAARQAERRLRDAGMPVEFTTVQLKDQTFYRLRIAGFDTQQDAKTFAAALGAQRGQPAPWVTCNIPGSSCQ